MAGGKAKERRHPQETEAAKKNLVKINLRGETIPHEVFGESEGGKVLLRLATNVPVSSPAVVAQAGSSWHQQRPVQALTSNHLAMVNATMQLQQLRPNDQIQNLRFGDKVMQKLKDPDHESRKYSHH